MDAAGWVFAILFAIALIIGIIFLILWLTKSNSNANPKKELSISGLKFSLMNSTTLVATWDSVGNANDLVTLYADTEQINFDTDGKPETTRTVLHSDTVSGTAKTVPLANLIPNTTYFAALVVTNPNISGHNAEPTTVYTGSIPATSFRISEISSDGAITLSSDGTSVTYVPGNNKFDTSDLWNYDTANFTLTATPLGLNSGEDVVLYNNNGTLSAAVSSSSNLTSTNSQWSYNTNGNNRWCLRNTDICMELKTPVTGASSIQVLSGSTTKWKNLPQAIQMF